MRLLDRTRSVRRVVPAIILVVTLLAAASPVSAERNGPTVPRLDWVPCGPDYPGIECAEAVVPLDYDAPAGATTVIALARVPASDSANRIGSLFVNPGGPGGSGVGLVLGGFGAFLDARLGGRFDIVGFDPRGVGASDPLRCFPSEDELYAFFDGIPVFPYERAQFRPFYERYRGLAGRCLGSNEAIARHMSTADVVRDLDLLRRAVGDRGLTYLGFSYGSYIGNTYANLFPRNVRALVIDGVLDPRLWANGTQVRSDRVATQQEFEEFLRLCDEAGPGCALSAPGGAAARWDALAAALRSAPLELEDGSQYTYDYLIADAASAMYVPEYWGGPDGYGAYFGALADAVLGDPLAAAAALETRGALADRLGGSQVREADYDNGFDAYYGNQCADTEYPSTFAEFRLTGAYAAAGSQFGPYWWWSNTGCASWPVAPDRYTGPWTARTSAPVLVVGNYFDGVTDYAGAQASARLLPKSRLLSYAGWGHTAYGRSTCVTDYVDAYLLDGTLPPVGTVCPANPNPFVVSTLRMATTHEPMVGLPSPWPLR